VLERWCRSDFSYQLLAVHDRHDDGGDDQIGCQVLGNGEGFASVSRDPQLIAFSQIVGNKEGDVLKFNYALAARIKKKFNLSKLDIKAKCEEYMNSIINMKIDQNSPLALTRDINEKLSFILMVIFKHIKKYGKFSDYEEVKQCASSNHQNGILDLLQNKSESNLYSYMYTNDSYIDDNDLYETGNKNTGLFFDNKIDIEPMRMSHAIQPKRTDIMNINNMYNYKSQNLKNLFYFLNIIFTVF